VESDQGTLDAGPGTVLHAHCLVHGHRVADLMGRSRQVRVHEVFLVTGGRRRGREFHREFALERIAFEVADAPRDDELVCRGWGKQRRGREDQGGVRGIAEPTLAVDDLRGVTPPTLVLIGDDDMIALDHTVALFDALPAGQLAVVPGTSHLLMMEKPALANQLIVDFLAETGPPGTLAPVRRA